MKGGRCGRRQARGRLAEPEPRQNPKKWYDQTFWIVVLLLAFWPVGIVLVWRSYWHVAAKVAASVFVAFCVYVVWNMNQAVMAMGY